VFRQHHRFVKHSAWKKPLDEQTVEWFEQWRAAGCALPRKHEDMATLERIHTAATTVLVVVIGNLMRHPDPWVRFAVAVNQFAPEFALWGDGRTHFGLAEDSEPWVRDAVLHRMPCPPPHVVEAVERAAGEQRSQAR